MPGRKMVSLLEILIRRGADFAGEVTSSFYISSVFFDFGWGTVPA